MEKNSPCATSAKDKGESAVAESAKISGIRRRQDVKGIDKIREHINMFRREKLASVFPVAMKSSNDFNVSDFDGISNEVDWEDPCLNNEVFKKILIKHCGKMYWDFLESGHPFARFWVQLKNGIEVIPRSEYVYYIQSILMREVEDIVDLGNSRMKLEFMNKYGFKNDAEVEDYLVTILEESDVENDIGVE